MPYAQSAMLTANQVLSPAQGFNPAGVLEAMEGLTTVQEAAQALGAYENLTAEGTAELDAILGGIPPALDQGIMATVRNALERGLPVQVSWQPGYAYQVKAWEDSRVIDGTLQGLVNVHLTSPHGPSSLASS